MEVMVVTLISAIVITIAYKGNEIFQFMYHSFRTKEKQISEVVFLNRIMQTDINRADGVYKLEEGFRCLQEEQKIDYTFTSDYIVRYYIVSDTFYIATHDVNYTFEDREAQPEELTDRISFIGSLNDDTLYFDYTKKYAADVLMRSAKLTP